MERLKELIEKRKEVGKIPTGTRGAGGEYSRLGELILEETEDLHDKQKLNCPRISELIKKRRKIPDDQTFNWNEAVKYHVMGRLILEEVTRLYDAGELTL